MRRDATNQRVYLGGYTNQTHGTDGGLTAFKIPYLTLVIQVLIAAGFAVIASLRTARRAGRLNVLDAIATE